MNLTRHRRTSYLALAAVAALSLSACGSTTTADKAKTGSSSSATTEAKPVPSAAAVYQQLRKSTAAAKSVHIKGGFTDKGRKLQIDMSGDRKGKNTRAKINDGSGAVEIIATGGTVYVKADAAFWTKNASAAMAKVAAGKYVKVPAAAASDMNSLKVGTLLDKIFAGDMSAVDKLNTKVETTDVNGVPAYVMTTRIGGDGTKIYASADGQAHLLRFDGPKGQPGTMDFTEWDAVAPVSAPPADQVIQIPGS